MHDLDLSRSGEVVSGADSERRFGHCLRFWGPWSVLMGLPVLGVLLWGDDWLRSQRSLMSGKDWSVIALVISGSANGIVWMPAILGLVFWFRVRGHRKSARAWMAILFAGVMAGLVGTTCRSLIGRTRPEVSVEQGWFGPRKEGKWILGRHAYSAFPSGHVSVAAGIGFMAFVWGRRAGRIGVVYALAVAWSRFHLGAHRASDVWAGLMVGSLAAAILLPRLEDWVHRGVTPEWWPRRLTFQGSIVSN